jgi:dolichol-phosphate mannosyltransferase
VLSVIVPTYNEAGALPLLIRRLSAALEGAQIPYEIVVVDDSSPDGTGELAERLAASYPIRVLRRPAKAGLASAVLDGIRIASGDLIGVMDADLSHPPEVIPTMVRAIEQTPGVDLAVGSRYVRGGRIEDWPLRRTIVSAVANLLTRWLTPVKDATSGFFVIRRAALEGVSLNPIGFKIGLEVIARARYRGYVEVPYVFTDRKQGMSKFGPAEVWSFLKQLAILYRSCSARRRPNSLPALAPASARPEEAPAHSRP